MKDIRQSSIYAEYLEKIGWKVEKTGKIRAFIRKLSVFGSVIKIQRPEEIDIEAINFIRKKHKGFQTIIEPRRISPRGKPNVLLKHGYRLSKSPYLPTKTLHLDLTKAIEDLFNQLSKDARYSLRKTSDLKIYSVVDTKGFRKSWKESVGFRRWVPSRQRLNAMLDIFKEDVIFLVTPDGNSGAIFLYADKAGYYWQAFSSKKGRKSLAQYKVVWAGINWAKEKGAKFFDFEGIYDERFPNKKWKGFTHFKKSFGGYVVEYPGAYTKFSLFDTIHPRKNNKRLFVKSIRP